MEIHVKPFAGRAALVIAVLTLGACSQYGVANRSISVNKGLESANNRMLLLNAVRASKRYPMVFSEVTQVSTSDPVTGSVGLQVPFGGDAASNFILTPGIDLSSGTKLQINPLNKQKFTRGITTPTSLETLNCYLRQGWPPEMLFHMFIRTLRIKNACDETLFNLAPSKRTAAMSCPSGDKKRGTEVWVNAPGRTPATQKEFEAFQSKLRELIGNKLDVRELEIPNPPEWRETTLVETVQHKEKDDKHSNMTKAVTTKELGEPGTSSRLFLGFKLPKEQAETGFDCIREKNDREACFIEVEAAPLRSPEAMIFYMGELIEAHVNSEHRYLPELERDDPLKENPILKVVKGRPRGGAAVEVSHEGETYAIPRADPGRSMHVLSLVSLILGTQREADELPTSPTVTLVGQ